MKIDLASYNNDWYKPGRGILVRTLWYYCNLILFQSYFFPFSGVKSRILRLFGAKVGRKVIWKPGVNIKYPWNLKIGNSCWIGEGVWIDNLGSVQVGNNVCISQGALLLCGNHNYKLPTFDLIVGDIQIYDEAWVGAKAIVGPGVCIGRKSILSLGSVAISEIPENQIFQGNPAVFKRNRIN